MSLSFWALGISSWPVLRTGCPKLRLDQTAGVDSKPVPLSLRKRDDVSGGTEDIPKIQTNEDRSGEWD